MRIVATFIVKTLITFGLLMMIGSLISWNVAQDDDDRRKR